MLTLAIEGRLRRMIDAYQIHASLPVHIESIARRWGWELKYFEEIAPIYGLISSHRGQQHIVVNADVCLTWQRLIIGHELGHWISGHLRDDEQLELRELPPPDGIEELQATLIAARLLIPDAALGNNETVASVAHACDVPIELVYQRLDFF